MCRILLKIWFISLIFTHSNWVGANAYDEILNAIKLNNIPAAEALFARGLDVNTTDPSANTLLMLAVRSVTFASMPVKTKSYNSGMIGYACCK